MRFLSTDASGYGKASLRDTTRSLLLRKSRLTHLKLPRAKDDRRAVNVQRHIASNTKPYTAQMKQDLREIMKKRRRGAACRRLPQRTHRHVRAASRREVASRRVGHKEIRVSESFCVSPMKVSVGLFGLENNVFTSLSETNLFNIPCCITC
ncbi:hypothetical protein NSTC745_05253 [Nostoc sp. DSM 114161]|jgi:hypothetical protein